MQNLFALFHFRASAEYLPDLLKGAVISVELTVIVMAISLVLGLIVALGRMARSRVVHTVAAAYVEAIRGTPLLLQLFYIYFVLPSFGVRFDPFTSALIGLTLNYAAYMSEVYRAGIQSVARGQLEAAMALGMSRTLMMRLVVLPQAVRIVVPPLGNYFVALFKDTALASIVTVRELMMTGQVISSYNYQYFTVFTIVGLIYFAMSYPGALGVRYMERRMKIGYRRRKIIEPGPDSVAKGAL